MNTNYRIDAANDYRSIELLQEEFLSLRWENTEAFFSYLLRLYKLHRSFYRRAVLILGEDGSPSEEIESFRRAARSEQKDIISMLRTMQEPGSILIERLTRNSRSNKYAQKIQQYFDDVFLDWEVDTKSNELYFSPEEDE